MGMQTPYYKVDDHPFHRIIIGNTGNLDPSTYGVSPP